MGFGAILKIPRGDQIFWIYATLGAFKAVTLEQIAIKRKEIIFMTLK